MWPLLRKMSMTTRRRRRETVRRGDGLSLYEEYRGFQVGVDFVRGDPTKKDFFLVDRIGGRSKDGIAIFRAATGLAVHGTLLPFQITPARLINFNSSFATHVTERHAVGRDNTVRGARRAGGSGREDRRQDADRAEDEAESDGPA